MSKNYRQWKNDMKIAHMMGMYLDTKPTLASFKSMKRLVERIDKSYGGGLLRIELADIFRREEEINDDRQDT